MRRILVIAFLLVAGSARADFLNTETLELYCTSQSPQDEAVCIVYITGAVDAFTTSDLIEQKTNNTPPQLCLPEAATPEVLKQTVLSYITRPETNKEYAATLTILAAITESYSC